MAATPRLIVSAQDLADIVQSLKNDVPITFHLHDGTEIEIIGGNNETGDIGREFAELERFSFELN